MTSIKDNDGLSDNSFSNDGFSQDSFSKEYKAAVSESNPRIGHMEEVDQFTPTELDARKLIYPGMHNPQVLNIFRELRTQLLQLQKKKNFDYLNVRRNVYLKK